MMRLLLCCLLLFSSGQAGNIFPVPPSFGDVAVKEANSIVVINLAPEAQGQDKEKLYYFCSSRSSDTDSISKVLSVQLGYSSQGCDFVPHSLDNARGISCDNCTGSEAHALRCCNTTLSVCDLVLALSQRSKQCQDSDSKRKAYSQDQSAYPGEVLLFPPVSSLSDSSPTSFSMGLVAVKKKTSGSHMWKFVTKDTPTVSMMLVSTFCRQMGFTHVDPGSVTTLGVARDLFNYNFSLWANTMLGPRLRTSGIRCPESECCLHCCHQAHGLATSEKDNDNDTLVIRCSYYQDSSDIPSGGDKDKCQYKEDEDELKSCATSSGPTSSGATSSKITFWLPITGLTILVCILFICNILLSLKCIKGRRERYENLEPEGYWRWCLGHRGNAQPANGDPPPDAHN